jgi:hypothetical protein
MSAFKRARLDRGRISYTVLRRLWYNIIFLNGHATSEDETDNVKATF